MQDARKACKEGKLRKAEELTSLCVKIKPDHEGTKNLQIFIQELKATNKEKMDEECDIAICCPTYFENRSEQERIKQVEKR